MTRKELQAIYNKMCEDFEKTNADPDKKVLESPGWFLGHYEVPPGMPWEAAFNLYMGFMNEKDGYNYYFTYDGEYDGRKLFQNLLTEQTKYVPTDVFVFEDEEEDE